MAIDTLKIAKRLREAGFTEPQAEAVVGAVQEGTGGADFVTKMDIAELRTELKDEIAELRTELRTQIVAVRSELREAELRLEARIEAVKSEILNRVFSLILGALIVNIVAMVGAVFAAAKLVAH